MMPELVAEKLAKKLEADSLAHLYLLRFNPEDISFSDITKIFCKEFFGKPIENHPDVLVVNIDEDESFYKVDSKNIEHFIKFLNYRPINFKHKFIFLNDAHLISEVLSNKLLKTLEELSSDCTIFLAIPKQFSVLPTIKSRSIEISLSVNKKNSSEALNSLNFMTLTQELKKEKITEAEIINYVCHESNLLTKNFDELNSLLNNIKSFNQSAIFNNSKNARVASLLP